MTITYTKDRAINIIARLGFKLIGGTYTRQGLRGVETAELRRRADDSWVFDTYSA